MQSYRVVAEVIEARTERNPLDPFTKSSYRQLGDLHLSLDSTGPAICAFRSMVDPVATDRWKLEPEHRCGHCSSMRSFELELLRLIASHGSNGMIGTGALAQASFEAEKTAGKNSTFYTNPPWFGLDAELRRLERLGFVDIDPGMAQAVPPGSGAAAVGEYAVVLTKSGPTLAREEPHE